MAGVKGNAAQLLEQRRLQNDFVLRSFTKDFRLSLFRFTNTVNDGRRRFDVRVPAESLLYGQTLGASIALSSMLKGEERVAVDIRLVFCSHALSSCP